MNHFSKDHTYMQVIYIYIYIIYKAFCRCFFNVFGCRDPINIPQKLIDLNKVSLKWKMSFHPDPSKQAQEVIFTEDKQSISPTSYFIILPFNKYHLKNI